MQCLATRCGVRVSELGFQACQAIKYVDDKMARPGRAHTQCTGIRTHHKDANFQQRLLQELTLRMSTCEKRMHCCANACLNMYRTLLLLNTNAETAPYIQDALVAKVYTSAMAALVQAGACQVSVHMGPRLAHATHRLVVKPASLVTLQAMTPCLDLESSSAC